MFRKRIFIALALLSSLLAGCSPATQSGIQWSGYERVEGDIELPFNAPPTMRDKAQFVVNDIDTVYQYVSPQGVLARSGERLVRIQYGEVVWSSKPLPDIDTARYVAEGGREWIVVHAGKEIFVYDAYSQGEDAEPIRMTPAPENTVVSMSPREVYIFSPEGVQLLHPQSGFLTKVNFTVSGDVLGIVDGGIIVSNEGGFEVLRESHGWGGAGTPVAIEPSYIVVQKGNETIIYNPLGNTVATIPDILPTETPLIISSSNPLLGYGPYVIDPLTGEKTKFPADIIAIHDKIAYSEDAGYSFDKEELWEANKRLPSFVILDGRGVFLQSDSLYFVNTNKSLQKKTHNK